METMRYLELIPLIQDIFDDPNAAVFKMSEHDTYNFYINNRYYLLDGESFRAATIEQLIDLLHRLQDSKALIFESIPIDRVTPSKNCLEKSHREWREAENKADFTTLLFILVMIFNIVYGIVHWNL